MSQQPEVLRSRPVAPSTGAMTAGATAQVAAEHQASQAALTAATLAAVLAAWEAMDPLDWFGSWWTRGLGTRVFVLLSAAQESAADDATDFVDRALSTLGVPPRDIPRVAAEAFAGRASDGRSLESLLAGAPITALQRTRRGDPPAVASKAGADYLRMVVRTEVPDAGRAADQVAITVADPPRRNRKKVQYGWVRMLTTPSCPRCIVLAGRFYRWNEGFQRHPMCDCRHIPAIESVEDDLTVNPYAYFNSLPEPEQNAIFGKANAKAIREGADINQVLNAATRFNPRTGRTALLVDPVTGRRSTTEGMTRRGFAGRRSGQPGALRPTPWQIYRDANGSRDEAVQLLLRFGYILR